MKKKILSLMLVFVMILMTACGSKEKNSVAEKAKDSAKAKTTKCSTLADVVNAIADTEVKSSTAECEFMGYKAVATCSVDGENYKMSINVNGEKVTDLIYVDKNLYVNVTDAVEFANKTFDKDYSLYVNMLGIKGDYVVISEEDLLDLVKEIGVSYTMNVGDDVTETEDPEKFEKFGKAMLALASEYLDAAKDDLGDAIKIDGSIVTVNISDENVLDILNAFKKVDIKPYFEKFVADMQKENVVEDDIDIDEAVQEYNDELDNMIEQYTEAKDDYKFDVKVSYGVKDKSVVFNANVSAEVDGEQYEGKLSVSTSNKGEKVVAPKEATDLIDAYNELMATIYQN